MQYSDKPKQELQKARDARDLLEGAGTLPFIEEQWKEYLRRLERAWNKLEGHYSRSPKWSGWQSRIVALRRTDPLLAYLKNARDVEEHSVVDITQTDEGELHINAAEPGGKLHIKKLVIGAGGQVEYFEAGSPFKMEHTGPKVRLVPVKNRSRTYDPPNRHLGQPIDNGNLVAVMEAGLAFYEKALADAEAFFVTK